jgi:hypothetical protein
MIFLLSTLIRKIDYLLISNLELQMNLSLEQHLKRIMNTIGQTDKYYAESQSTTTYKNNRAIVARPNSSSAFDRSPNF